MKICVMIAKAIMNFIYAILKCLPVRDKIVFLSRQNDEANIDFIMMIQHIEKEYPQYECKVLAKRMKPGLLGKAEYSFHILQQMYHLATSKYAILDTYCIPVSLLHHRKELKVIQIWHAIGAFKKFGYSVIGKEEGSSAQVAHYMKMHKNYDYVCSSSAYCKPFFAEAFHLPEEQVVEYPLPRLDRICVEKEAQKIKRAIYKSYPQLAYEKKKVILYAPTFRKGQTNISNLIDDLVEAIDFSKYRFIIKKHPLSEINIDHQRVLECETFETSDMLLVADYVITDYSAIVFEAAVAKKPILFYATDYETYSEKRDFYTEYETTIPGTLHTTGKAVIQAIEEEDFDMLEIEKFRKKYVKQAENNYTDDLVKFILDDMG